MTKSDKETDETISKYRKRSSWTPKPYRDPALDACIERDILTLRPLQFRDNLSKHERSTLRQLFKRKDIIYN